MQHVCICGYKCGTEKPFLKHTTVCQYLDLEIEKVYQIGFMIDDICNFLFHVSLRTIHKYSKNNNISIEDARIKLKSEIMFKYRKSLWDIYKTLKGNLLFSEWREFMQWSTNKYQDISLISMKNTFGDQKKIYRYNIENTVKTIEKRINDSLITIHEQHEYANDFEFVNYVMSGKISMYYLIFNDWLAISWFERLDKDLQDELSDIVEIASKTVLDRLKHSDFDTLQMLACTDTPVIHSNDF